jgi:hypothetical protein
MPNSGVARRCRIPLLAPFGARDRTAHVGVGLDETGVNDKILASDKTGGDTGQHDALEDVAQHVAVAKRTCGILERVVGHLFVKVQTAEPAERQPIRDLLAQTPLLSDAIAVADDEHADEQLGIDRRPPGVTVVVRKLMAQIRECTRGENIDAAEQMIGGTRSSS